MSTIASPRPSIALSSRRNSTSTDRSTSTTRASNPPTTSVRRGNRDRAALRDYYNLPKPAADAPATPTAKHETEKESELDQPNFHAESYVKHLLQEEGLEGILRVESRLVSEIRSLDGEKKALVYDNYSKLITATDTIRSMREKMDPGAQTKTLVADIERIGETAAVLQKELRESHEGRGGGSKTEQRETVRWVLGAPERLGSLVREGRRQDAEAEWRIVEGLLGRWEGVRGAEEVGKNNVATPVVDIKSASETKATGFGAFTSLRVTSLRGDYLHEGAGDLKFDIGPVDFFLRREPERDV